MHMIFKSALAVILSTAQAAALSCIAPDIARTYLDVAASEKTYVVVHGTFSFAKRPDRDPGDLTPEGEVFGSIFRGKLLTGVGFSEQVEAEVKINTTCAASWCGGFEPDTRYVAFIEQEGRNLNLLVDPCYRYVMKEPAPEVIATITACASGRECSPKN